MRHYSQSMQDVPLAAFGAMTGGGLQGRARRLAAEDEASHTLLREIVVNRLGHGTTEVGIQRVDQHRSALVFQAHAAQQIVGPRLGREPPVFIRAQSAIAIRVAKLASVEWQQGLGAHPDCGPLCSRATGMTDKGKTECPLGSKACSAHSGQLVHYRSHKQQRVQASGCSGEVSSDEIQDRAAKALIAGIDGQCLRKMIVMQDEAQLGPEPMLAAEPGKQLARLYLHL